MDIFIQFSLTFVLERSVENESAWVQIMASRLTGAIPLKLINVDKHDDVIKWKHFPRYWSFVRGIHRSPVNSPHKGQWRVALMVSLVCARINGRVNNREAGDLRRHHAHCDVTVVKMFDTIWHNYTIAFEHPRLATGKTITDESAWSVQMTWRQAICNEQDRKWMHVIQTSQLLTPCRLVMPYGVVDEPT